MLNSIVILCRIASSLCHAKHMWSRKIMCLVLSNRDCTFSQCEEGQAPGQGRALQKPCCQQKLAVLHTGLKLCIVNKHKRCGYGQCLSERPVLMGSHLLECAVEVASAQLA